MTKYYPYGVSLSKGQLEKLSRAYNNNSVITIRLARNELSGPHQLMLAKTQINKLRKAMNQGTGSDIEISKTQIRKAVRRGGSLWGSLINLGSKLLPMAMPLAKKAAAPLVTGALSGLASLDVDKIFGKGQRGNKGDFCLLMLELFPGFSGFRTFHRTNKFERQKLITRTSKEDYPSTGRR